MTGKERFLTALKCGQPDMVPMWELAINEPCIVNIGRHFTDNVPEIKYLHEMTPQDMVALLNTLKLVVEEVDLDGMTMPVMQGRDLIREGYVRDHLGIVYQINPHGEPLPVEGPISGMEDVKSFKFPEIDEMWMIGVTFCKSQFGENRATVLMLPDPFKIMWSLRGRMENTLIGFIQEPELSHAVAELATDFCIEVYHRGHDAGVDAFIVCGDLAMNTTTIMSPAQFNKYIKPCYDRLVREIHSGGDIIVKHSDGNLWPILDDLLDAGFDGLHPVQPQCMDISEVKEKLSGRACVLGNIDCLDLLPSATPEEVDAAVRDTIKTAAPGGGYILSSSNTIHPDVRPENAIAMWKAARKYGKYPIDI